MHHRLLGVSGDLKIALVHKRTLLVLDNLEHLLDAAAGLADLLAACPGVVVTGSAPSRRTSCAWRNRFNCWEELDADQWRANSGLWGR